MKDSRTFWLNYFRPSLFLKKYSELNIYSLKKNGIKVVICDLDNTLAPHFTRFPSREAQNFKKAIQDQGVIFILASNNTKKRVLTFASKLRPDDVIFSAKKPFMFKIKKTLQKYNVSENEIVVIGDQIVTDVWLANRIGCKSILVLPSMDPAKDSSSNFIIKFIEKYLYQKLQHNNYLQGTNTFDENNSGDEYEII